jgi:hypothetical protein
VLASRRFETIFTLRADAWSSLAAIFITQTPATQLRVNVCTAPGGPDTFPDVSFAVWNFWISEWSKTGAFCLQVFHTILDSSTFVCNVYCYAQLEWNGRLVVSSPFHDHRIGLRRPS